MRVHFWAAEPDGCAYYRCLLPMAALNEAGACEATTTLAYGDAAKDADVLVGQRLLGGKTAFWDALADAGRPLVYELDDDFWHLAEDNPARRHYPPEALTAMQTNLARSVAVTVSTAPLAEVVRAFNPNVHVVPNFIDRALLDVTVPRHGLTVGWAGGPTHRSDLAVCAKAVRKVLAKRKLVQVHLIGTDYRRLLGAGRFTPWQPWVPNYYAGLDFDIGLAPLADTPFNRSKSRIKALEYAALGIPVIASPVGEYPEFVRHGETGFLAHTPEDWARYLRLLIDDPKLRFRMGAAAREWAAEHTIQGNLQSWLTPLTSVLERVA